jgi:hypothetical protein
MFNFSLVDVKSINSDIPRSSFSESKLDGLAQIILDSGGLIKPLILKMASPETYVVLDGHLEYYAAVRAQEKDARKGEMVNAFVISPKSEKMIIEQAQALKITDEPIGEASNSNSLELESRINRLDQRITDRLQELDKKHAEDTRLISERLKKLEETAQTKISPLAAFNDLEAIELSRRLTSTGISQKRASIIAEAVLKERKKGQFETLKDVSERVKESRGKKVQKMLSEATLLNIVDIWSQA